MQLAEYLRLNGMTAAVFARQVGMTRQAVGNYLSGDRFPHPEKLIRIKEVTAGLVTAEDFVAQYAAAAKPTRAAA
jgi:transcriptional regulator with XRE-family HTH domain